MIPLSALAATLLSALIHASWNLALKGSAGDRMVDVAIMGIGGSLFGLVLIALFGAPVPAAWPYILASSAVHLVYWTALTKGYGAGDMSHVYTIARGIAPALVTVAAVVFASEVPGWGQGLGVLAISAGVMLVGVNRHAPLAATGWALLTGAAIAVYSLVDALGVRINDDVFSYKGWGAIFTFLPISLFVLFRRGPTGFIAPANGRWRRGLFAGAISSAGFMLVLWAQMRAPIGPITALRETSVLFGAALAALLLKETVTPRRWAGALVVCAGAVLIGFA
ncbi:DMT family transporter [Sandarakinorhabdus sp.]|uniref:DMT family transporter n=1 Tax=Sandarakinorhabdus sp. TaxID=1916663 RepID=UPI00286D716E|nr:DMT family transporter [Sandarakinorhabdus sp.]